MKDQLNSNDNGSISLTQQHNKNSELPDPTTKTVFFLSVDLDTHIVFVEESPINRKTEANAIGRHIRFFASLDAAKQLKRRFDRRPYLVDEYLKSL